VSIKHMEQAGDTEGMDPTKKLVLMALCDDASKDTRVAYPGMEKLRRWSGRSERRVVELVEELIRDGLLARKAFAFPGRHAEFIVYPTDEELAALDEHDPRLNASRRRPPRKRKPRTQPVDNSTGMGAAPRVRSDENGRDIDTNGRDPGRVPPVSTPLLNTSDGPVPDVTTDREALAGGTGPKPSPKTVSDTAGKPLSLIRVREAVGPMVQEMSEKALAAGARRILDRGLRKHRSIDDPTGYVIAALRNPRDGLEQLSDIWADDVALSRVGAAGY
jgi:hypothetical protein